MQQRNNETTKSGFTLIEVLTAIFLIVAGLIGALSIISQTISFTSLSSSKLVANYLAQEGIETVRNIRDGNWLEQNSWTEGLLDGDWQADYNDSALSPYNDDQYLKIDNEGFYNYESGNNTKFRRKITIVQDTDEGNPRLKVSVLVEWQQIGSPHKVTAQEYLYNWY